MRQQRGAASGFLMTCVAIILAGVVLAKVVPPYIQYYSAKQILSRLEHDPETAHKSRDEIREAFFRQAGISSLTDITPDDLVVTRRDEQTAFKLEYSVKVHLLAQMSLVLDFFYATPS